MAIRSWLEKDLKLLRFELSGELSTEEMLDAITSALQDPEFEKGYDVLTDHTRLTHYLTTPEVASLTQHFGGFRSLLESAKWAAVTTNPTSYGMMRMLSVYVEEIPITLRIFETEGDALLWLRPERAAG